MSETNLTRASLLVRVRNNQDQTAWGEFVDVYSPLIYGFARKQGLQDADAVDVTQEVLRVVSRSIGRLDYDADRGSFRGWLFTLVRNELKDWFSKQRSALVGVGGGVDVRQFAEVPATDDEQTAAWDRQHEQRLFEWAAERVQSEVNQSTWQAFWKSTVENQSGKAVATELGLSVAAVYLAKGRVMARLKELLRSYE